jgi:hypothetical protein
MVSAELDRATRLTYSISDPHRVLDTHLGDDRSSLTSSNFLPANSSFETQIAARDRSCVVTGLGDSICYAAHLIPYRKGDNVRFFHTVEFLVILTLVFPVYPGSHSTQS